MKEKEQDFRRIREDHEKRNEDPLRSPAVMVAQWSRRLTEEELELRKLFMENERIEHTIHQLKITRQRSQIGCVAGARALYPRGA